MPKPETSTPTEATPTEPVAADGANAAPTQLPDDHPLVKALAAQKEQIRALKSEHQEYAEKAKRLDEIEEASKTEAQKQAERLAELESKVSDYETREQIAAWRDEVSELTKVPASALRGNTREEIEAHAEQLKPLLGAAQQAAPPAVVPTIGKTPSVVNVPLRDQIAAAEIQAAGHAPGTPERASAERRAMELKAMQLFELHQASK